MGYSRENLKGAENDFSLGHTRFSGACWTSRWVCPVGGPAERAKLQGVKQVSWWHVEGLTKDARTKQPMVGKENVSVEIMEGKDFRKEGTRSFKKEDVVRARCYRRTE